MCVTQKVPSTKIEARKLNFGICIKKQLETTTVCVTKGAVCLKGCTRLKTE